LISFIFYFCWAIVRNILLRGWKTSIGPTTNNPGDKMIQFPLLNHRVDRFEWASKMKAN